MYPFYLGCKGLSVSAPLLQAECSGQGGKAEHRAGEGGYGVAQLYKSVRRMGKIKSQNCGRILKGEIEN